MALCGDYQFREIEKDAKRKYKEMNNLSSTNMMKFLSVYGYQRKLKKSEVIKSESILDQDNDQPTSVKFATSMHYYQRELTTIPEACM